MCPRRSKSKAVGFEKPSCLGNYKYHLTTGTTRPQRADGRGRPSLRFTPLSMNATRSNLLSTPFALVIPRSAATRNLPFQGHRQKPIPRSARNDKQKQSVRS